MGKILIIGILLAVLIYFILRRLNFFNFSKPQQALRNGLVVEINVPTALLKRSLKRVMYTVGSGIIVLMVVLLLAAKFKIALIMLPISLYLIGQFFVFNNHISTIRKQMIHFDKVSQEVQVQYLDGKVLKFDLHQDVKELKEVHAVQKNNGLMFGYYKLHLANESIILPYLLKENPNNNAFFEQLAKKPRTVETKLFPII